VGGRWLSILVALTVLAAVTAPAATPSSSGTQVALTSLQSRVLQKLNEIRAEHGLVPLHLNARLSDAAMQHTREMTQDGYFAHESHDGTVFWRRISRWYGSSGYGYWSVGENLLWSSPDVDSSQALRLWMRSPEHRENILDARWREIGVAALHASRAPGTYHGRAVTVITTDFGARR
jgi:uncharacterized protein YkwD